MSGHRVGSSRSSMQYNYVRQCKHAQFIKLYWLNSCGAVTTRVCGEHQDNLVEFCRQHYPIRRVAAPEDVAELVAFVVSSKAHCITGAEIPIDGGHLIAGVPLGRAHSQELDI